MTKRQAIETFRQLLKERNADSDFTNQFLYNELIKHAKWLIKRETSGGRIYTNTSLFQSVGCVDVIEVPLIDECCSVKSKCKIYRTKNKLPDTWADNSGPILKSITSVDGSTDFFYTTPTTWASKASNPYNKLGNSKYTFFENGYLWFPENNPHKIKLSGFFVDEVKITDTCEDCSGKQECIKFLDTKFVVPEWIEAELFSKALQQVAQVTMRLQEDEDINKNTNRKN